MPERILYRCLNCGERFEASRLSPREVDELEEEGKPTKPISCPKCNRRDLREGWE